MQLSSPKIKNVINFSQKKCSYILRHGIFQAWKKKHTLTNFLIFQEIKFSRLKIKNFLYFFQKNVSYISVSNFQSLKSKNFLCFGKWNLLYLIFFVRVFFIRIFLTRIIRSFFKVLSNILKHLFFINNIFTFF